LEEEKNRWKEDSDMMKPAKDSLDVGILVSDIEASLNFYQKILGLSFWKKGLYGLRCTFAFRQQRSQTDCSQL
jgi:predicted enzyme related to lactoylglutathione lyase